MTMDLPWVPSLLHSINKTVGTHHWQYIRRKPAIDISYEVNATYDWQFIGLQLVDLEGFWQGESTQAELQKAQTQLQTLSEQLQQALEQAEKQKEGLESKLHLHVQEESGLIAMLAHDFELSQELQQKLTVESGAHVSAIQELRDQVCFLLCIL